MRTPTGKKGTGTGNGRFEPVTLWQHFNREVFEEGPRGEGVVVVPEPESFGLGCLAILSFGIFRQKTQQRLKSGKLTSQLEAAFRSGRKTLA